MKKILLACSSGMSTSLLVTKMKDRATSIGDEAKIWAVGQDRVVTEMDEADVILIGPQMRFLLDKLKAQTSTPIEVIDMMAYGTANGKAAYEQAMKLMG
ncbi:MAG: PTS sugar transporter subunit IIB [Paracoccaceae bacterium]|nr:MAG: PTS sugar transporter subunit IIB [Paracoccaceae bacterium]